MITRAVPYLEMLAAIRWAKRKAERQTARVLFAVQRKKHLTPLTEEQVRQYRRDGYLLVPGLIPDELARGAATAMWEAFGATTDDPRTWRRLGPSSRRPRDPRIAAAYTDTMMAAAAQLAGEDVVTFLRPSRVLTVNVVPVTEPWVMGDRHIDYVIPESRHRTFPRPFRVGAMTYLSDVQSHGGGTVVWPGSHLQLEALARSDPGKYKFLAAFHAEIPGLTLAPPIELTPSRGDVLFHDYLCVHAGSKNVSQTPRLAMNHKW